MLKPNSNRLVLLALLPLADEVLAHPASRQPGRLGIVGTFFSSPVHFGTVAAVALLLAVGAVWGVKRGR
ncbi:MAG: hypothetical protein HZT40_06390 [Candidatus Thiothrix singaporensis]|uniref:Uncharacterized protein n=1 Tax=Candidatus Thiothrix singaporensis TaxID=2799669 RepID=A0A7L6AQC6_9GAMM|nr:MAG: hypothetical protein HZT40_06390 [Candidatus Thiothrix singaporensis]